MSIAKPTVNPEFATTLIANGANTTNNKVEPSSSHKSVGFTYPEKPPRNYLNWLLNAHHQWQQYFESWIDTDGAVATHYAQDEATTAGLNFGMKAGKYQTTSTGVVTTAATVHVLSPSVTTSIYLDLTDGVVKKSTTGIPATDGGYVHLFEVITSGVAITSITDNRTWAVVGPARATTADAATGTDNSKYLTAAALLGRTANDTRTGLIEIATQGEVNAGASYALAVTPLTLAGFAGAYLRLDGTTVMTGNIKLGGNRLLFKDNGLVDQNYVTFDDATDTYHMVSATDIGAGSPTGNAKLRAGTLNSSELICDKASVGAILDTDEFYMRNPADSNKVKIGTRGAILANLAATETRAGIAEIATHAETTAGAGDGFIVSPFKLKYGFLMSISGTNGYVKVPDWLGGWVFQYGRHPAYAGSVATTITFPLAFPTACKVVTITGQFATSASLADLHLYNQPTTTNFTIRSLNGYESVHWWAFGN